MRNNNGMLKFFCESFKTYYNSGELVHQGQVVSDTFTNLIADEYNSSGAFNQDVHRTLYYKLNHSQMSDLLSQITLCDSTVLFSCWTSENGIYYYKSDVDDHKDGRIIEAVIVDNIGIKTLVISDISL